MNKVDNNQAAELNMEIERLRKELNRQNNFAGQETLELSRRLDQLIIAAMKLNGYV